MLYLEGKKKNSSPLYDLWLRFIPKSSEIQIPFGDSASSSGENDKMPTHASDQLIASNVWDLAPIVFVVLSVIVCLATGIKMERGAPVM